MKATDIVLASCRSGRFLERQLESIFRQDDPDFRLLVRDDCSNDATPEILRNCSDPRLTVLPSEEGRLGACANFGKLLEYADAELVLFADHDDIWMADKLRRLKECYRAAAAKWGADTPLLIFSDAEVIDEAETLVASSALRYQNLNPRRLALRQLLLQNVPAGNTMLCNRALCELAKPLPAEAVMHDHWMALTAAAFGRIVFLDEPTIQYRQHGENVFGAQPFGISYFYKRMRQGREVLRKRFFRNVSQAAVFLDRFRDALPTADRRMLEELCALPDAAFWEKRRILIRNGIWKNGLARNLGTLLIL